MTLHLVFNILKIRVVLSEIKFVEKSVTSYLYKYLYKVNNYFLTVSEEYNQHVLSCLRYTCGDSIQLINSTSPSCISIDEIRAIG